MKEFSDVAGSRQRGQPRNEDVLDTYGGVVVRLAPAGAGQTYFNHVLKDEVIDVI